MLRIVRIAAGTLALLWMWLGAAPSALADASTKKFGYCAVSAHVMEGPFKVYVSATFATVWPIQISLESRFQSFVESKYGVTVSRHPECVTYATTADAQKYRAERLPPVPGHPYVETDWVPEAATERPATPTLLTPPVPTPTAIEPSAPAPAAAVATGTQAATYVICKSDFNTDMQRFYNPPVDGRGGGYPVWQASYGKYLEQNYHHTSTNLSCSKYPTQAAAQTDYDSWVTNPRASSTVNGLPSPIFVTSWKY